MRQKILELIKLSIDFINIYINLSIFFSICKTISELVLHGNFLINILDCLAGAKF